MYYIKRGEYVFPARYRSRTLAEWFVSLQLNPDAYEIGFKIDLKKYHDEYGILRQL